VGQKTLTSKVRRYLRRYDLRIRLIQDWPKFKICITPFPVSLTRGRTRFWSVVIYLGSRMFCFLWRLVRPSQNGERAGPLAKMLLGAKHGGRPRIVSRIIVEEYFALWVFPTCSTAMFYFASGTQETTV